MKKWISAAACMAAACMIMSGCAAGNASGLDATHAPVQSPAVTAPSANQIATVAPMTSPDVPGNGAANGLTNGTNDTNGTGGTNAVGGVNTTSGSGTNSTADDMTPAQAGRLAERIGDAVERLSEVDDAEVAIHKGRVLVAVEFDDQYKAGLDDRMKQMITEAVKDVDDRLTDVQITDDDTLYGQIKGLGERIGQVTGLDELADDFGDLWDRIVGRR